MPDIFLAAREENIRPGLMPNFERQVWKEIEHIS